MIYVRGYGNTLLTTGLPGKFMEHSLRLKLGSEQPGSSKFLNSFPSDHPFTYAHFTCPPVSWDHAKYLFLIVTTPGIEVQRSRCLLKIFEIQNVPNSPCDCIIFLPELEILF